MKTHLLVSCAASAVLMAGTAGAADSLQTTMNVRAEVNQNCSDVSVSDLDFGSSTPFEGSQDTTTLLSVTCGVGTSYDVEMDYGLSPAAPGSSQRQVADANTGEFMDYDLFQPDANGDADTSAAWGTRTDGAEYHNIGTGSAQSLTVTGRLHRHATNSPGTYTDTVVVQVNF
jgi:spore coat protein U-like protein